MKEQILEMLKLQDKLNSTVNPDWRNAGSKWTDAIMVEAVEAIEHYGWKWWKKQDTNIPQVQMELVDIWHFALSISIEHSNMDFEPLSEEMNKFICSFNELMAKEGSTILNKSFIDTARIMVAKAAYGEFDPIVFLICMEKVGLTFDELYKQYVGKNCLNIFRQAHGYKTGSYIKDWSEFGYAEDNEFLVELLNSYNPEEHTVTMYDYLYENLSEIYSKL